MRGCGFMAVRPASLSWEVHSADRLYYDKSVEAVDFYLLFVYNYLRFNPRLRRIVLAQSAICTNRTMRRDFYGKHMALGQHRC